MAQDFLRSAKSGFRRNTVCIARKADKGEHKKDKSDSAFQFPRRSDIIIHQEVLYVNRKAIAFLTYDQKYYG